jgi:hypothetical protein
MMVRRHRQPGPSALLPYVRGRGRVLLGAASLSLVGVEETLVQPMRVLLLQRCSAGPVRSTRVWTAAADLVAFLMFVFLVRYQLLSA